MDKSRLILGRRTEDGERPWCCDRLFKSLLTNHGKNNLIIFPSGCMWSGQGWNLKISVRSRQKSIFKILIACCFSWVNYSHVKLGTTEIRSCEIYLNDYDHHAGRLLWSCIMGKQTNHPKAQTDHQQTKPSIYIAHTHTDATSTCTHAPIIQLSVHAVS